jgi:hypothetical protein
MTDPDPARPVLTYWPTRSESVNRNYQVRIWFLLRVLTVYERREEITGKSGSILKFFTLDLEFLFVPVLRIRIHRIHMFLGLLDPDPLVRGMVTDPDPSIIEQK